MIDSKNFKKIANTLEEVALLNINKAIKKYTNGAKVTSVHCEILKNLKTSDMSDSDHMLYVTSIETLYIIFDNGDRSA